MFLTNPGRLDLKRLSRDGRALARMLDEILIAERTEPSARLAIQWSDLSHYACLLDPLTCHELLMHIVSLAYHRSLFSISFCHLRQILHATSDPVLQVRTLTRAARLLDSTTASLRLCAAAWVIAAYQTLEADRAEMVTALVHNASWQVSKLFRRPRLAIRNFQAIASLKNNPCAPRAYLNACALQSEAGEAGAAHLVRGAAWLKANAAGYERDSLLQTNASNFLTYLHRNKLRSLARAFAISQLKLFNTEESQMVCLLQRLRLEEYLKGVNCFHRLPASIPEAVLEIFKPVAEQQLFDLLDSVHLKSRREPIALPAGRLDRFPVTVRQWNHVMPPFKNTNERLVQNLDEPVTVPSLFWARAYCAKLSHPEKDVTLPTRVDIAALLALQPPGQTVMPILHPQFRQLARFLLPSMRQKGLPSYLGDFNRELCLEQDGAWSQACAFGTGVQRVQPLGAVQFWPLADAPRESAPLQRFFFRTIHRQRGGDGSR